MGVNFWRIIYDFKKWLIAWKQFIELHNLFFAL